jgi:hypothetical protein
MISLLQRSGPGPLANCPATARRSVTQLDTMRQAGGGS